MTDMRILAQLFCLFLALSSASPNNKASNHVQTPIYSNTIQRYHPEVVNKATNDEARPLKKVFLSNRTITCNDGSQAGFYLRKSHTSKKWIIFLEGGWYCYDTTSCRNRWMRQRHLMTSARWPATRDSGILSPNPAENPFHFAANHVFVPYCTSDSWSGRRAASPSHPFSFQGAAIVAQVVRDLLPLGMQNGTELLLAGSSAGGTGAMLNVDAVREQLRAMALPAIAVRGVCDSGWFLDRAPFAPTGRQPAEAVKRGMELWRGQVPRRCKERYAAEPWRCYFGYRLYPTLESDLFVFQWLFDEAQMDADNVGAPVTKQQWDYIHKMGDALRHSFENVSAVFAPSCISHSVLTKRDWQNVKIDDISIAEALHCWEQKLQRKRTKQLRNVRMMADGRAEEGKTRRKGKRGRKVGSNATRGGQRARKKRRRMGNGKEKKRKKDRVWGEAKNETSIDFRPQRSVLAAARNGSEAKPHRCMHRRLERCSWPQCNHSCPRLHNPFTGEEMDFIELLKSFGLDMESVAKALGIDMQTLNNMEHGELLNLLTQQSN